MKETTSAPSCERSSDLIAFLYNETDERETGDFQLHLRQCSICREEAAAFGAVRESITAWRDESLAGFVNTPAAARAPKKSALAALRQFLDLSPLWLKGATALAVLMLCVLTGWTIVNRDREQVVAKNDKPGVVYTQQEVDRLVQDALAKQVQPPAETPVDKTLEVKTPTPKRRSPVSTQLAKSRRPLSRAEREQLAADLRLLSTGDDEPLYLLGDPINR